MSRTPAERRMHRAPIALALSLLGILAVTVGITFCRYVQKQTRMRMYPRHYQAIVEQNSASYGIPCELIYAVIRSESNFDPNAESPAGAKGLMQLMPQTYEWIAWRLREDATEEAIWNPGQNIRYGCYLLSYYYRKYGNWESTLAAYNAGDGNVDRWLADPAYSEDGCLTDIPFAETRDYVKKVEAAREVYRELYHEQPFEQTVEIQSE